MRFIRFPNASPFLPVFCHIVLRKGFSCNVYRLFDIRECRNFADSVVLRENAKGSFVSLDVDDENRRRQKKHVEDYELITPVVTILVTT